MYKLPPNIVKTFASTFKKEKPKTKKRIKITPNTEGIRNSNLFMTYLYILA